MAKRKINDTSFMIELPAVLDEAIKNRIAEEIKATGKNVYRNAWVRNVLYKELNLQNNEETI